MNPAPKLPRILAAASPASIFATLTGWADKLGIVASDLDWPDLAADGRTPIAGNIEGQVVQVLFTESGVDTPVTHLLGRPVSNYVVFGKRVMDNNNDVVNGDADIRDGERPPGANVLYLRCVFASPTTRVRARICLHGGRRRRST